MTEEEKQDLLLELPIIGGFFDPSDERRDGYLRGFDSCLRQTRKIIKAFPKKLTPEEKMN